MAMCMGDCTKTLAKVGYNAKYHYSQSSANLSWSVKYSYKNVALYPVAEASFLTHNFII